MKKVILVSVISLCFGFFSCKVDVAEKVILPSVESFSPGYVKTGDTVNIIGVNIIGSTVKVGGKGVTLLEEVAGDKGIEQLSFIVTDDLTTNTQGQTNENYISLEYAEGAGEHEFTFPLVVNYVILESDKNSWLSESDQDAGEILQGPKQLLISDFDDAGIRKASNVTATGFDQTQFAATLKDANNGGGIGVVSGIDATPAGGGVLWVNTNPSFVEQNTNGFTADIETRSELMNNQEIFPDNFAEYPFSPIEIDGGVSNTYINMLIFKNNSEGGTLFPYLYNDDLGLASRFRYNGLDGSQSTGLAEWEWIYFKVNAAADNFGFSNKFDQEAFEKFNKFNFTFGFNLLKDQGAGAVEIEVPEDTDPIEIYIDHIIITQGAPFYGHIR